MSGARKAFSRESNTERYASSAGMAGSGSEDASPSAGGLDLRSCRLRERIGDDEERGRQLAAAEDLERLPHVADQPDGPQDVGVDRHRLALPRRRAGRPERPGVDARCDVADVDDLVIDLAAVPEAAELRNPHVERRLTTLEPRRDRAAGARLLALRPATGGLALAGGDAPPDAGAGRV